MFIRSLTFLTALLLSTVAANAGYPVDVTVAQNGCAGAVANDGVDDYAAIQCHINYMNTNFGGGILVFPSGAYDTSQTLVVPGAEMLTGMGAAVTSISSLGGADVKVLRFDGPANSFGGMDSIRIVCSQSTEAKQPCVHVSHNVPVTFRDSHIWGGQHGLQQDGVDGMIINCIIAAAALDGANLFSRGANWYVRTKFNPYAGQTVRYAYAQNDWATTPNNGLQENHFVDCDFSGTFTHDAVAIYDNNTNQAITTFEGSVFSAPVTITAARATLFNGVEFGSTIKSDAPISLVGNYAVNAAISVTGSGTRACAGNLNISC